MSVVTVPLFGPVKNFVHKECIKFSYERTFGFAYMLVFKLGGNRGYCFFPVFRFLSLYPIASPKKCLTIMSMSQLRIR